MRQPAVHANWPRACRAIECFNIRANNSAIASISFLAGARKSLCLLRPCCACHLLPAMRLALHVSIIEMCCLYLEKKKGTEMQYRSAATGDRAAHFLCCG